MIYINNNNKFLLNTNELILNILLKGKKYWEKAQKRRQVAKWEFELRCDGALIQRKWDLIIRRLMWLQSLIIHCQYFLNKIK